MQPFTTLTAAAVPMDLPNIDTDRVIPARFLRKSKEAGLGSYFFHDVRFNPDGSENGDFILNQAPYRQAKILVTAENFGCGSSREAAVWALMGSGFRCVIGPSFGDIFFENCFKNGALAVVLPRALLAAWAACSGFAAANVTLWPARRSEPPSALPTLPVPMIAMSMVRAVPPLP